MFDSSSCVKSQKPPCTKKWDKWCKGWHAVIYTLIIIDKQTNIYISAHETKTTMKYILSMDVKAAGFDTNIIIIKRNINYSFSFATTLTRTTRCTCKKKRSSSTGSDRSRTDWFKAFVRKTLLPKQPYYYNEKNIITEPPIAMDVMRTRNPSGGPLDRRIPLWKAGSVDVRRRGRGGLC